MQSSSTVSNSYRIFCSHVFSKILLKFRYFRPLRQIIRLKGLNHYFNIIVGDILLPIGADSIFHYISTVGSTCSLIRFRKLSTVSQSVFSPELYAKPSGTLVPLNFATNSCKSHLGTAGKIV